MKILNFIVIIGKLKNSKQTVGGFFIRQKTITISSNSDPFYMKIETSFPLISLGVCCKFHYDVQIRLAINFDVF